MTIAYILGFAETILFFAQLEAKCPDLADYPISTYVLISAVWPLFWIHVCHGVIKGMQE